jgi:hypothetical protein
MANQDIPDKQRALVLQGGGALGAYDAGVFQAIYEKFHGNKPLFDIIAGTSSGAMNAAILVSHVTENNNSWKGSAGKLNDFWNYVSRAPGNGKIGIPQGEGIPGFGNWWEYWHSASTSIASEEAARRYYSAKQFQYTGCHAYFSHYYLLEQIIDSLIISVFLTICGICIVINHSKIAWKNLQDFLYQQALKKIKNNQDFYWLV